MTDPTSFPVDPKPPAWSWKDRITVTTSLAALIISVIGTYFSLFRDATAGKLAVVAAAIPGELQVDVAVMNTGNRQLAVTKVLAFFQTNDGASQKRVEAPLRSLRSTSPALPVLIEPGRMEVFKVGGYLQWQALESGRTALPGQPGTSRATVGISVRALGVGGQTLEGKLEAIDVLYKDAQIEGVTTREVQVELR
jgi:urease beta subunit